MAMILKISFLQSSVKNTILFFTLISSLIWLLPSAHADVDQAYNQALQAYLAGNYRKAQTQLADIVSKHWNDYRVVLLAGYVSWKMNEPKWVDANFRRAMQLKPNEVGPYDGLIHFHLDYGKKSEAVRIATEATRKLPKSWQAWNLLALANLKMEIYDRAISAAEHSLNLYSSNLQAYNILALAYMAQEKWQMAEIALKSAQSIEPKSAYIINNLGVVAEKQKRLQDARALFEQALKLNPFHPTARENLERIKKELS